MNAPPTPPARHVLAVLDDTVEGALVIEWSAALAHTLQRELAVVYVESTPALVAAALPGTLVLAHAGAQWAPFTPPDVERGFRVQVQRLRTLAGAITLRHAVNWSLRTVRGALPHTALELLAEGDLLFVASPLPLRLLHASRGSGAAAPPTRATRVATVTDGSEAGARGVRAATQLAQALSAPLQVLQLAPGEDASAPLLRAGLQHADVLVLPRALASQRSLARAPCPTLLVA
jgi:hypothetical protein